MLKENISFNLIQLDCFDINFGVRETMFSNDIAYTLFLTTREFMVDFGEDKNPELVEYVINNEIPCKAYRTHGGTLVMTPQDAAIMVLFPHNTTAEEMVPFLKKQLFNFVYGISEGHIITEDHNDILMDGFKVSSYSYNQVGYVQMFNFNINEDTLSQLPLEKPRIKIPKGITELTGKTKEHLFNYLNSTLVNKNYIE